MSEKVKFYTNYDKPQSDFESYVGVESVTVPDQAEPVAVTVARCLRGEVLQNVRDIYYEFDDKSKVRSLDEALGSLDRTQSPGFDLADVPSLLETSAEADVTRSLGSSEIVGKPQEVAPEASTSMSNAGSKTESQEPSN